jgi:glycosyltransferase involved in cell wall biosynthesis
MLWLDVTTSVRNATRNGIAGVEWHFVQEVLRQFPDARLVALKNGELVAVDWATLTRDSVFVADSSSGNSVVGRSSSARAARAALAFCHPVGSPNYVRMYRKLELGLKAKRKIQNRVRPHRPTLEFGVDRPQFVADDCLISLGADWSGELFQHFAQLRKAGVHIITMVHDLIPLTHAHLAFHSNDDIFTRYYNAMLATSSVILANSEESKNQLLKFAAKEGTTNLPPVEPFVIGARPIGGSYSKNRDDFFLCVGTVERRKNLEILFDATRMLAASKISSPKIVLVGAIGWGVNDWLIEMSQSSDAAQRFVFLGPVDDIELDGLLRSCRALLMPSHYEGWGLPLREAAATGAALAVGNSPAVREALRGYEGATFLDSHDTAAWAKYLSQPSHDVHPPLRLQTWDETVQQVVSLVTKHLHVGFAKSQERL